MGTMNNKQKRKKLTKEEKIKAREESKHLGELARIKNIKDNITPNQKYFKEQTEKDDTLGV